MTAVQEAAKVTVVVLVNAGFQSIHSLQLATIGSSFGNEFRRRTEPRGAPGGDVVAIDYAAMARALGCRAWTVDTRDELERALGEARAATGPTVIECRVEPRRMVLGSGAWWDLGIAREADDPRTRELAAAHAAGAAAQRFFA